MKNIDPHKSNPLSTYDNACTAVSVGVFTVVLNIVPDGGGFRHAEVVFVARKKIVLHMCACEVEKGAGLG
jgi:hypothetical protein